MRCSVVSILFAAALASPAAHADDRTLTGDKARPADNHNAHPEAHSEKEHAQAARTKHGEGVVVAERAGEKFRIRVRDARGHIPAASLKAFESLMKQGSTTYPADPRLVALVGVVADHFNGKTIEVVSGYRAHTPAQFTPHSNHNYGKALDFRIVGVRNDELWMYCRSLRNAGCGLYPNSGFVHLDVRDTKAYWVDRSMPGEAPKYDPPGIVADESGSERRGDGPTSAERRESDTSATQGSSDTPAGAVLRDSAKSM
jgi:uncharacterized protein YcbK (DUF882 family)